MKKSLVIFALLALLSITLSACNVAVTSDAAQVDGTAVLQSELNANLHASTSSALFNCLLNEGTIPTKGAGVTSTFNSAFAAEQLTQLVDQAIIENELAKLHLQPTALASSMATQQLDSGLSSQTGSSCTATGAAVVASLPPAYRSQLLKIQLDQDLLGAHLVGATLTTPGVAAFATQHPTITKLACVSAILVATQAKAKQLDTQLRGGASFSALAKANSTDSTSAAAGGALGCYYPGEFSGSLGNAIASLPLDQPSAPVVFSSNWVILEVTQRQPGTASGAELALISDADAAEANYADHLSLNDHIWINSQYGHWGSVSGHDQVIAPVGPKNNDLVNSINLTPLGAIYN